MKRVFFEERQGFDGRQTTCICHMSFAVGTYYSFFATTLYFLVIT